MTFMTRRLIHHIPEAMDGLARCRQELGSMASGSQNEKIKQKARDAIQISDNAWYALADYMHVLDDLYVLIDGTREEETEEWD